MWTVLDPRACLAACAAFSLFAPAAGAQVAEPAPAQAETPAAPPPFAVWAQLEAGITANPDQPGSGGEIDGDGAGAHAEVAGAPQRAAMQGVGARRRRHAENHRQSRHAGIHRAETVVGTAT